VRLNKYISETGVCSRREADKLIEAGRVTCNGSLAVLGTQVGEADEIRVDGRLLGLRKKQIYIALNKPAGITCTTETHVEGNIIDLVGHKERIFPIGRLDKDSEGLILLTNDGDIVNEILRSEITKPCKVSRVNEKTFRMILTQGLNRQIRRMCSALGYRVQHLRRVRIINIDLGTLAPGEWRELAEAEVAELLPRRPASGAVPSPQSSR